MIQVKQMTLFWGTERGKTKNPRVEARLEYKNEGSRTRNIEWSEMIDVFRLTKEDFFSYLS